MRLTGKVLHVVLLSLLFGCSDPGSSEELSRETNLDVEVQRFANIPTGQSVSITLDVSGCYEDSKHVFTLTAGDQFTVEISEALTDLLPSKGQGSASSSRSGVILLSKQDVARLDNALSAYRAVSPSSHYARDMTFKIAWPQGVEELQVDGRTHGLSSNEQVLPFLDLIEMAACEGDG